MNIFLLSWLLFNYDYLQFLPKLFGLIHYIGFPLCFILCTLFLWFVILLWLIDYFIESFIALTIIEQLSLITGIKLLLLSEFMLFFACFWCYINFRLIGSYFISLVFPLLSLYSFGIPFTNLLLLLFSSLPIQSSQIFIKVGLLSYSIEGLGQSLSAGFYFIVLQFKEFLYSYFSISDGIIGSIYYFTTGLHGFHVLIGSFLFFIILFYLSFFPKHPFLFMEFHYSLFLSSYYWHFVDFIWFIVFLLLIV